MGTPDRSARAPIQAQFWRYLPVEQTFKDAWKLLTRFHQAEGFRQYARRRAAFIVPAVALFSLVSIACAAATVIVLAEQHAMLALPGMVLAPFVLAGSFFVQAFVFFSWLEGRALAQALGRRGRGDFNFGPLPRVPWALAAVFLVMPLVVLATVSGLAALVLILLGILIIVAIARYDR